MRQTPSTAQEAGGMCLVQSSVRESLKGSTDKGQEAVDDPGGGWWGVTGRGTEGNEQGGKGQGCGPEGARKVGQGKAGFEEEGNNLKRQREREWKHGG